MLDISVPLPFGGGERGGFERDGCERIEEIGFKRFQPLRFAAKFWVADSSDHTPAHTGGLAGLSTIGV